MIKTFRFSRFLEDRTSLEAISTSGKTFYQKRKRGEENEAILWLEYLGAKLESKSEPFCQEVLRPTTVRVVRDGGV